MFKLINYIALLVFLVGSFSLTCCKKSDLPKYNDKARVHFYKYYLSASQDSVTYSFAIRSAGLLQDTVKIPVRIIGTATTSNRTIRVRAVPDSTTAVEGTEYVFLPAMVRAGRYEDSVPVLVKRSAAIKTKEVRLLLEIVDSEDLLAGVPNSPSVYVNAVQVSGAGTRFLLKINDYLTKPSNWDSFLVFFFGSYSAVKYKFIIDVTGRTEFLFGPNPPALPYGIFSVYQQMMQQALLDYEAIHGPMIDENGNRVTF